MSVRSHAPHCAKTELLEEAERMGLSAATGKQPCTCGAEYEVGARKPAPTEQDQHIANLAIRIADLEMQLHRERDSVVFAVTHALAWADSKRKSLEKVAEYMDKVWKQSEWPYEPGPWVEDGGLRE